MEACDTDSETIQALLELRLLRVFREFAGPQYQADAYQLAEQIVKRRSTQPDNAG